MANPTRLEHNCETGETIEIELTDAEVAELAVQAELAAQAQADRESAEAEAVAKKAAVLAALAEAAGLTIEEVTAVLN